MKKLLSLCLLLLTTIAGWGQTTFTQGDFTYTVTDAENHYVSIAKAEAATLTGALVIPSSVTYEAVTYAVTSVEASGFNGTGITSVTIPASVLTIGDYAFQACGSLACITIEDSETPLTMSGSWYPRPFLSPASTIYIGRNLTLTGGENNPLTSDATSVEFGPQVTTINPALFYSNSHLARITIGSGVTTISESAFYSCGQDEGVTETVVSMGSNVTSIGTNAFRDCPKLKSLTLPSKLTTIGDQAFNGSGLTSISIPASVTTIGEAVFQGCNSMTGITIADSETPLTMPGTNYERPFLNGATTIYIGRNLTLTGGENNPLTYDATSVVFGPQVTTINPVLFYSNTKLENIIIGNGVTTIGGYAFQNTGTDESVMTQSITLGANVTTIGDYAFSGCNKLTTLDLGTKLTAIPENMLFGCSALTGITIPASVQSVGAHAFYDCDGLTSITIEDSETALEWNGTDYHPLNQVGSNYTLYLGRDLTTEGNQCFFPGATSVEIGDQMTTVNPYLFDGANKLASVTMGSGVTTIGDYAFRNTGTDESVTAQSIALGTNVITIGDYAFSGCNKLTTLALGRKLTAIPENMLFGCSALTGITIPASVQSVGAHAFYDCDGLATITIEDSGTALEWNGTDYHPLDQVNSNYTLYLGRDLTTEGNQCFFPGATSVEIGDQMTTVNPYLFDGANKLASVTMGSGVTTIGDYAFRNTGTDESVTAQSIALGANVITIGDYAFSGCNKLTTLDLGTMLTAIPENMLFGCSALTGITIPASVQSVGAHAFYDCDGLTTITIEDSGTALEWNGTDYHPLNQVGSNYTLYLGRDLTTEGNQCFFPGATSVEFGPQVTVIPNYLFSGVTLSSVKVPWLTPVTLNAETFSEGTYTNATLLVPGGTKETYEDKDDDNGWKAFTTVDHWSTLVTLTASAHGSIVTEEATASNGTEQYRQPKNDAIIYTLNADTGYQVTALTDNAAAVSPLPALGESQTRANASGEEFVTLNATFSAISYTLGYELAGGSVASDNPTTYTIESTAITLNNPTREGYTFTGWTGTGLDAATTTVTIAAGSTGNRSYTATWTPTVYNIVYTDGGTATPANPTTYTIETPTFTLTNPTKTGYTFKGWKLNGEGDAMMTVTITQGSTGDKAYTATWQVNQYTITFESNGGTEIDAIKQDYATEVVAPTNPERTGYTFAGWTPGVPATIPAENITCVAQWTINQYTITFNTAGGSVIAPIVQDYATAVVAPANPTREGYTFAGWDKDIPTTIPAENVTITATWTPVNYTISYDLAGGSVASANPTSYNIESAPITLINPTKDGYDFAGWTGTGLDAATKDVIIATGNTGNRSYTATWTKKTYTVSITGGGVTADSYTPEYGDNVVLTIMDDPDATLTSLTVNGLEVKESIVDNQYTITSVSGNVSVVATWSSTKEFITLATSTATFSCSQDLNFTGSELRAYIAAGYDKDENSVLLVRVYNVPANTGLVIRGEEGETYKISYSTSHSYFVNLLKEHLTSDDVPITSGDYNNYVLKRDADVYKWQRPTSGTMKLGAKKAYLQLPTSFMTAAARELNLVFEDDSTTDISKFVLLNNGKAGERIYNLNGQQVDNMRKGVYIVNGRKVMK